MSVVLIPTNDLMIIPGITEEYARRGFDVVVGTKNFFLQLHRADLVHVQWPEELAGWELPSRETLDQIRAALDGWAARCPVLVSANNLYPHGYDGHPVMKELYEIFYGRCSAILHYSKASQDLVMQEFPSARDKIHVVTNYFCYDRLLPKQLDREGARRGLRFRDNDFVVLVFGQLRFWSEVRLIQRGYSQARVRGKRLLMAGRFIENAGRLRQLSRRLRWKVWLTLRGARSVWDYIPDSEVHRYVEAADVILVPRLKDMTSGLVGLGLSFGRTIVCPTHGAYPEYLAGTGNPFYESAEPGSLARAIENAATMDRRKVERQNREIADSWTWQSLIGAGLEAVRQAGARKAKDEQARTLARTADSNKVVSADRI
jgi:glycosyltransferase involved in cell wall biosynthesis